MSHFAKNEVVGDFRVTAEPLESLRRISIRIPIIKRFILYYASEKPKIRIKIESAKDAREELDFKADLYLFEPNYTRNMVSHPIERIEGRQTPFEYEFNSKEMLRLDGNTIYELVITPKQNNGSKLQGGSVHIAQIPVVTIEFLFIKLVYLIVGAIIGVLLTFFLVSNNPTP